MSVNRDASAVCDAAAHSFLSKYELKKLDMETRNGFKQTQNTMTSSVHDPLIKMNLNYFQISIKKNQL